MASATAPVPSVLQSLINRISKRSVIRRKDGTEIAEAVVVAPIRQPDGRITHYAELKQDITERKRAAQEIHRLAHFDSLTSLPNRFTLMERLAAL